MTTPQFYLGVKMVMAMPEEKEGKPGYAVHYKDGHESWSPAEVFEKAYFPIGPVSGEESPKAVTLAMIEAYMQKANPTRLPIAAVDVGLDFALAWARLGLTKPGAESPPIPFGQDADPPEPEAPPTGPVEAEPEPEPDEDEDLDEDLAEGKADVPSPEQY